MSAENHPAYQEEREHLDRTLARIDAELLRRLRLSEIVVEDTDQFEESMHAIRAAQEALESLRDEAVARLSVAALEPYFGRIDFVEEGAAEPQVLYIGKSGFAEPGSDQPLVIDWRAPVASLFYGAAAGGKAAYTAPGGVVTGRLLRKRSLAVKWRRLQHIADADPGVADDGPAIDPFLLYRLQESRDHKLRDIVSTIQAEQNAIIRAEPDRPVLIQGVAGSGKTTVALHRLAYLLYTHRDTMAPERMIIFAPSRMFLDYIADVLPELGVGGIRQVTFQDWALGQLTDRVAPADAEAVLEERFRPGRLPGTGQEDPPGRFKGSLRFKAMLDRALERYEAQAVPEADLVLWPGAEVPYREIRDWYLRHYRRYPLNTRKDRIFARLRTWARAQLEPYRDEPEERDRRKAMVTALRRYLALWPTHSPLTLYREILGLGAPRGKRPLDLGAAVPPDVTEASRYLLDGTVATEDLAPLVYLQERLEGLADERRLDHVVIDEAQDFSPFQVDLLRRLTERDSFTILGDLSQAIHAETGVADWSEIAAVFPPGAVQHFRLERSYRSTAGIVTFANRVLARVGLTEGLARPVYREGPPVRLAGVARKEWVSAVAEEVRRLQSAHASVAVVCRTGAEARALADWLRAEGLAPELITPSRHRYLGGLSVIASYLTKGLEFDAVLVADAGAHNYALNRRDARLLYVVCTRALHELSVLYTGEVTPLLAEEP